MDTTEKLKLRTEYDRYVRQLPTSDRYEFDTIINFLDAKGYLLNPRERDIQREREEQYLLYQHNLAIEIANEVDDLPNPFDKALKDKGLHSGKIFNKEKKQE